MVVTLAAVIGATWWLGASSPLRVLDVRPAITATDVTLATQVVVTFSAPIDAEVPGDAIVLSPRVDGFVSVAGRRVAFTPGRRLQADTPYTVTIGGGIRDHGGRTLASPLVSTFRTAPLSLLARTRDRRLVRMQLGHPHMEVVRGPIGSFAAAPSGAIAWTDVARHVLVVRRRDGGTLDVSLPGGLTPDALEWVPGEAAVAFLDAGSSGAPFVVRLDRSPPAVGRLGGAEGQPELPAPLVTERLKRSLVEVVYGRDSYALTAGGAVVRDRTWDLVVVDLDGRRRATVGPFLAVGDVSPRGDGILVVDVDPADPALVRSVGILGRDGALRRLSMPEVDAHAPRFSHAGDRVSVTAGSSADPPAARRFGIAVIDVETGTQRVLTMPPAGMSDDDPRWSPDDAWLLFRRAPVGARAPASVWVVAATGGDATPVGVDLDVARWMP